MRLSMYILCLKIKDFFGQHMFSGMPRACLLSLFYIVDNLI